MSTLTCTPYIDCTNNDLDLETLFKMLVVYGDDGDFYLKTNDCGSASAATTCGATGTFTNADLVGGKLQVNHACGSAALASCMVIQPAGGTEMHTPDLGNLLGADTTNWVTLDFGGAIGAGTFTWTVITII